MRAGSDICDEAGKETGVEAGKDIDVRAGSDICDEAGKETGEEAGKETGVEAGSDIDDEAGTGRRTVSQSHGPSGARN